MEPESLQSILQEAGVRVDMANLQNPTETFMIYLIIEYLNKFYIDGNEISKVKSIYHQSACFLLTGFSNFSQHPSNLIACLVRKQHQKPSKQ